MNLEWCDLLESTLKHASASRRPQLRSWPTSTLIQTIETLRDQPEQPALRSQIPHMYRLLAEPSLDGVVAAAVREGVCRAAATCLEDVQSLLASMTRAWLQQLSGAASVGVGHWQYRCFFPLIMQGALEQMVGVG
jgi:hypothetical protein